MFMLISVICWALTCYCRTSKPRPRVKTQKYALLESQDNEVPSCKYLFQMNRHSYFTRFHFELVDNKVFQTIHFYLSVNRAVSLSESDTDSDVLFENQHKPNGVHRNNGIIKNCHKTYTTTRLGRRIEA